MARTTFMVISEKNHDGKSENWRIQIKGSSEVRGHYATQDEAIQDARREAKGLHEKGEDTQVLVQASTGEWRTEWTYGHDPSPPAG